MNKEQEELILSNRGLVHHLIKKFNPINKTEYDDYSSEGMYGLIKAALTYDKSKKIKFSTYAAKCINNQILMYLRKNKKYKNCISLEDTLCENSNGDTMTFEEAIPDTTSFDKNDENNFIIEATNIILNNLKPKEKTIMLYRTADISQNEVAEKLKLSQSYVSRIEKKAKSEIKKIFNRDLKVDNKFFLNMDEEYYIFCFQYKEIKDTNNFLNTLSEYLRSIENSPYRYIVTTKEYIKIYFFRDSSAFIGIAEAITIIDKFSVETTETNSNKNVEASTKAKRKKKVEKTTVVSKKPKEISSSECVRRYILSKDTFTTKEVKTHFLNVVTSSVITSVLHEMKVNGLINNVSRGRYVVNKIGNVSTEVKEISDIKENASPKIQEETIKEMGPADIVRDYILSKDSFTIKELNEIFPNISHGIILSTVRKERKKHSIYRVIYDRYAVNKN